VIGAHTRSDRSSLKKDLEMIYGYFPILAKRKDQLSIFLSGGEQQM
jgi:branched-chain amino acid transport system ATP-binding protein